MPKPHKVCQEQTHPDIDRGWAWIVMIVTYLGMTVYCTTLYMNGVLYMALLDRYHENEAKTSLVGAVSTGLLCYSAPFGGVLNNRFSCRFSIVIGGILTTTGFALSAYVPGLNWMIVTSGAIVGLGYGISSSGLICVVGFYFEKWRDVVLSLAFLTVGVAMFLSAPLGLYMIDNHGLTATFLIIACIQAQMCVFGVICKPSVIENEVFAKKKADRASKVSSKSKTYLDLSLLKNVPYMGFLCSTATWNFALTVAIMHLPNYVSVLGGSSSDIGYLLSSFSVANLVGRLSGSLTISKLHHKSLYVHVLVLGVTGVLSSLFPLYSSITGGVYIFTIQLGIFTGWPNAMMTPLSLGFVGVAKLSEAYGLAYVFCGIGVSTGPVLIGYLYSISGSYEYSFLVAGGVLILGCLFGVGTLCIMRKQPATETYMETVVVEDGKQADLITTTNEPIDKTVEIEVLGSLLTDNLKSKDIEEIKDNKHEEQETDSPSVATPLIHSKE